MYPQHYVFNEKIRKIIPNYHQMLIFNNSNRALIAYADIEDQDQSVYLFLAFVLLTESLDAFEDIVFTLMLNMLGRNFSIRHFEIFF